MLFRILKDGVVNCQSLFKREFRFYHSKWSVDLGWIWSSWRFDQDVIIMWNEGCGLLVVEFAVVEEGKFLKDCRVFGYCHWNGRVNWRAPGILIGNEGYY